jgi:6-phosphofructokinase 1
MALSNLMIVQGGGPTAVFNTSLAAIIAEAQRQPKIGKIYGARFGVEGLIRGDVVDLTEVTAADLELLTRTPGAALGSSRHSPEEGEMAKLAATLHRLGIDLLLFAGGNGTMRGADLVSSFCRSEGMDVRVIGVPKTVDNDIAATDRCPGYGSAARYIASATRDLGADVRSLPQPVTILEAMGRSVGWIAAASALARTNEDSAPHLVYVPEVALETERFLAELDSVVQRLGWAVVVVAEGVRSLDGSMVYETSATNQSDPLRRPMTGGVAQHLASLVGERLGIRCRSEKPGLLGRASIAYASARDIADAALVGRAGVQALVAGEHDAMIALSPLTHGIEAGTRLVPLNESARERPIPSEWLQEGHIPVTRAFLEYVDPLAGALDEHIAELGTVVF